MLKIFTVENAALPFDCGSHDQGVIPRDRVHSPKLCSAVDTKAKNALLREVEGCRQVLLRARARHGFSKPAKRDIEEFLYHLVADNPLPCFDRSPDQSGRSSGLLGSIPVKRVEEDICVEEEPIAHSSHPA